MIDSHEDMALAAWCAREVWGDMALRHCGCRLLDHKHEPVRHPEKGRTAHANRAASTDASPAAINKHPESHITARKASPMPPPPLTPWTWVGTSIALRELQESDLPVLVAWLNLPDVASTQTAGPIPPKPLSEACAVLTSFSANRGADLGLSITRAADGELLGHLMLYGIDAKDRCGTVSILVGPPHQGRGVGYEALGMLIRYAFAELGLHRLELSVNAFNDAAIALYKKLQFVEEGRRRLAIYRGGNWHDHILMGLLASEWHDPSTN